jgi:hypothetical protein
VAALGLAVWVRPAMAQPAPTERVAARAVAMAEVQGDGGDVARDLQVAVHRELVVRDLVATDVVSISELRLAMACRRVDDACMAQGGRAMGLQQVVIVTLVRTGAGLRIDAGILDTKSGSRVVEARVPIVASALARGSVDATAAALVDQLFPGSKPTAPTPAPAADVATEILAEPATPTDAPAKGEIPRWKWIGFGVSAGAMTVFAATLIGVQIRLRRGLRDDLLAAADDSLADDNPGNDVDRGAGDLCRNGRESPTGDGKVRNKAVTQVCNRADVYQSVGFTMMGLTAAGLASTIVFAILLAVPEQRRGKPRRVALVPGLRLTGGPTLTLSGRF